MPSNKTSKRLEPASFKVSPQVLGPLGAEQLQDPALAVLELVKNSWDADAEEVQVAIDTRAGTITVSDDGHGMSVQDFRDRWLIIGASHKRRVAVSEGGRTFIGEKGLGRLATYALGRKLTIHSSRGTSGGFEAVVNWRVLFRSESIEQYEINIKPHKRRKRGTKVTVSELSAKWTPAHTDYLVTHVEFLTAVPGESFRVSLRVDRNPYPIALPTEHLSRFVELDLEMRVNADGLPEITRCVSGDKDLSDVVFRAFRDSKCEPHLKGARISVQFFRRDRVRRQLKDVLDASLVAELLDRYQGVRVFRDGINVPPYGLKGDDWAGLEKLRTTRGAKTMVPGNSQVLGEVHLQKRQHSQFVITAGRAGFADHRMLDSLAEYVRWAVLQVGTARRAERLGIATGEVPSEVSDTRSAADTSAASAETAISELADVSAVRQDPALRRLVRTATRQVRDAFKQTEETLRLYAQLASSGIAATSFAHELRTDFDVVSEAVREITAFDSKVDDELAQLLASSWSRIAAFAGLFQVVPVRLRRRPKRLKPAELEASAKAVLGLAAPDRIHTSVKPPTRTIRLVPAELDSILINLVSNAIKAVLASPRRDDGRIRVVFREVGSDLEIGVADNGVGVTKQVAAVMFEPLEGAFSEGTGMGLPIAQYLAGRYGGTVWYKKPTSKRFRTEMRVVLRNVVKP